MQHNSKPMQEDWKSEFNSKWGKMCLVDDMGGHYIGSYVMEFIEGLLHSELNRQKEKYIKILKDSIENCGAWKREKQCDVCDVVYDLIESFKEEKA